VKTLELRSLDEWRDWLASHHETEAEIWLVFWKRHTARPTLDYGQTVEIALCFGWIDSLVKRLDENRYCRKFTPRKPESRWSAVNRKRVERMINAGRMQTAGLALVDAAKRSAAWDQPIRVPPASEVHMPAELADAIRGNSRARSTFDSLPPSERRNYMLWVGSAKRPETRVRRAREAAAKLAAGEKLGLK